MRHFLDGFVFASLAACERVVSEMARGFDELGIVQRSERLQWRVRALAADGANFAAGRVEDVHRRRWRGAFPEGVEAATIESVALVGRVLLRVALRHRDGFPDAARLIRLHTRTTDFLLHQTARGNGVVTHHFGVHAEARAAAEEPVLRIFLQLLRRRPGALAIGG